MKFGSYPKKMKLLALSAILFSAISIRSVGEEANKQSFDLKVATVFDASKNTLAFTIKNNGQATLEMVGPGFNSSPIFIVTPSGKVVEHVFHVELPRLPVQLKPSESKTWKIDNIVEIFKLEELKEPGLYKISWKLKKWISEDECVDYNSNDIFLLKE